MHEVASMGRIEDRVHYMPLRVYYEDTDASGIVYYANYLKFIERARTDMLRLIGVAHSDLMRASGLAFTVRRCHIDYRMPARLDDEIEVLTRILAVRGASLDAEQNVRRDTDNLVSTNLQIACIDSGGRARRLPKEIRTALLQLAPTTVTT